MALLTPTSTPTCAAAKRPVATCRRTVAQNVLHFFQGTPYGRKTEPTWICRLQLHLR